MSKLRWLVPTIYILFLLLPIYWLVSMSFKTTNEILGGVHAVAEQVHARQLSTRSSRTRPGTTATSTR